MKTLLRLAAVAFLFVGSVRAASPEDEAGAAANAGDVAKLRTLLDGGLSPDARDYRRWPLLVHAAKHGQVEVARLLLDRGADVNARTGVGCVALTFAASQGSLPMVDLLLARGARTDLACFTAGDDPLYAAIFGNHPEVIRRLVEKGAPVNEFGRYDLRNVSSSPLFVACSRGDTKTVGLLLDLGAKLEARNNADDTALTRTVRTSDLAMVKFLLARGADPLSVGPLGGTPLIVAAAAGQVENVKLLLDKGADPSAAASDYLGGPKRRAIDYARRGKHMEVVALLEALGPKAAGIEPDAAAVQLMAKLNDAIIFHQYEQVQLLLSRGANPQGEASLWLPVLHMAVSSGDADIVRLLLDAGANVEARKEGMTPLAFCASQKHPEIARLLIKHGADVNVLTREKHTALQMAEERGDEETAKLLREAGATENPAGSRPMPSALYRAVSAGKLDDVRRLLPGGDPNEIDDYGHPILVAAGMNVFYHSKDTSAAEIVGLLLDAGADPNASDRGGRTPLMQVLGNRELVRRMIAARADVNARDRDGNTPLFMAGNIGDPLLIAILKEAGAKESP